MSIERLALAYNTFQNSFGQSLENETTMLEPLFSPHLRKVANGVELVSKKEDLASQLIGVKGFAGLWTIAEKDIIPSLDGKKCTIRYILESEKAGSFDVIAILTSANGQQIDSIDEIYYQIT